MYVDGYGMNWPLSFVHCGVEHCHLRAASMSGSVAAGPAFGERLFRFCLPHFARVRLPELLKAVTVT